MLHYTPNYNVHAHVRSNSHTLTAPKSEFAPKKANRRATHWFIAFLLISVFFFTTPLIMSIIVVITTARRYPAFILSFNEIRPMGSLVPNRFKSSGQS